MERESFCRRSGSSCPLVRRFTVHHRHGCDWVRHVRPGTGRVCDFRRHGAFQSVAWKRLRLKHLQHRRHTRNCGDDPSPVGQAAGGVRGVTAVGWDSAPVLSACLRRWRILPFGRHHPVGDFLSPSASLLLARQEIEECECVCELCACGNKTTLLGCLVWRACPTRGIVASAGVGSSFGGTVAWRFGAIDRSHYRCSGYIASGTGVGHSLGAERPKRLRARQDHRIEFLQYACRGRFERHIMPVQGRVTPRSLARFAGYGSRVVVHWLFRDQLPETIWRWADLFTRRTQT